MTFHRQGCLVLVLLTNGILLCGCQQVSERVSSWKSPKQKRAEKLEQQLIFARLAEKEGKFREAAEAYGRLHTEHPDNADVCHRFAIVQNQLGNMPESDAMFQKALQLNPNSADILTDYGYSQYVQGNNDVAESLYRKALKEAPTHKRATTNLAIVMGHKGAFEESYTLFRRVVPEAEAHANLGYIHVQRGEGELAIKRYSRALDYDPDLTSATQALLEIAELKGRLEAPNSSPFEQRDDVKLAGKETANDVKPTKGTPNVLIEDIVDAQEKTREKHSIETVEWAPKETQREKQLATNRESQTQTLKWEQEADKSNFSEPNPFAKESEAESYNPAQDENYDLQNFPAAQSKQKSDENEPVASTERKPLNDEFPWSGSESPMVEKTEVASEANPFAETEKAPIDLPVPADATELAEEDHLENPFVEELQETVSAEMQANPFSEEVADVEPVKSADPAKQPHPFEVMDANEDPQASVDVDDATLVPFETEEAVVADPVEELGTELPIVKELHAFRGYCPVMLRDERMLVKAKEEHTTTIDGVTYEFSSSAAKVKFEQTPRLYEAVAAGLDVVMLIENDERVHGSIAHGQWYQQQLYLFNSRESMERFVEDPNRYVMNNDKLAAK